MGAAPSTGDRQTLPLCAHRSASPCHLPCPCRVYSMCSLEFALYRPCVTCHPVSPLWQHKKPPNPKGLFSIECVLYRMCVTPLWQHKEPLNPKCLLHPCVSQPHNRVRSPLSLSANVCARIVHTRSRRARRLSNFCTLRSAPSNPLRLTGFRVWA
jgi:hypothetical protein